MKIDISKIQNIFFKTALGIEINGDSLVVAYMKNTLSGAKLISSTAIPFSKEKPEEIISEIKKFITQNKITVKHVSLSIPREWAIMKFMDITAPGKDSLKGFIQYEIEKHIPFQMNDVLYNFHVFQVNDNNYKVAIVAVPKEKVEAIISIMKNMQLKVSSIGISAFNILNAIGISSVKTSSERISDKWQELLGISKKPDIFGSKEQVCVSLYQKPGNAEISVFKGGACTYLGNIILGDITDQYIYTKDLSVELNKIISDLSLKKIDKLVITGYGANRRDVCKYIEEKLGIKVIALNPVAKFSTDSKDAEKQELIPSMGACLSWFGLGSIRMNIASHTMGDEGRELSPLITKIAIAAMAVLIFGILVSDVIGYKRNLSSMERKLKQNAPEMLAVEKMITEINDINKQKKYLLRARNEGISKLKILSELTNIIPLDTWITNFEYKETDKKDVTYKGELLISGFSASASKLISLLENSPIFENVEFVGQITKNLGKENFRIKMLAVKSAEESQDKK